MSQPELLSILNTAARELAMEFAPEASGRIAYMSQGLPNYTHLLGLYAVRSACKRSGRIVVPQDVHDGAKAAVAKAEETIVSRYAKAIHSSHKDAKYAQVLLACAMARTDAVGMFQLARVAEVLARITKKPGVDISTFARHIAEFCQRQRGAILQVWGQQRRRRYRFRDPLLPPYVIMKAMEDETIKPDDALVTLPVSK